VRPQFADLAALSADPLTVEEKRLAEVTSLMTMVGGHSRCTHLCRPGATRAPHDSRPHACGSRCAKARGRESQPEAATERADLRPVFVELAGLPTHGNPNPRRVVGDGGATGAEEAGGVRGAPLALPQRDHSLPLDHLFPILHV